MSQTPESNLIFDVDLTNPGQFFACCGVIEILYQRWRRVASWFDADRCQVAVEGSVAGLTLRSLLTWFRGIKWVVPEHERERGDKYTRPHEAAELGLRLDWWLPDAAVLPSPKTWSGAQNIGGMIKACAEMLLPCLESKTIPFDYSPRLTQQPFYLDKRRSGGAQDTGYSPDKAGTVMPSFPIVELLAVIGLQRFRPLPIDGGRRFEYGVWSEPLPVTIASAVVGGQLPMLESRRYRFDFVARDAEGKRKSFGESQLIRRSDA